DGIADTPAAAPLIYREPVLSDEAASMRRISFQDGVTYTFGPDLTPIAKVRSGETVEFVCQDACGGQIRTEKDTLDQRARDRVNGATGPVRVIGSRPGMSFESRFGVSVWPSGVSSRSSPVTVSWAT